MSLQGVYELDRPEAPDLVFYTAMQPEMIKLDASGVNAPQSIRLLAPEIIHRIAAGEIVDRPSSLLKELIENSLDAKATEIKMTLIEGGIEKIQIEDNGWGMSLGDLRACVQRHATSKISKLEDLDAIASLGFRGEALAAGASVSKLKIDTFQLGAKEGWQLEVLGGNKRDPTPSLRTVAGTKIEVQDLFFNVPARKQFLKRSSTELSECLEIFQNVALGHPQVHFEFFGITSGGELKAEKILKPTTSLERFKAVTGLSGNFKELVWNTDQLKVPGLNRASVRLGEPPLASATQKSVKLTVNSRFVVDKRLPFACREGFLGLLEINAFPVVWVDFEIDPKLLDVNVHPQKKEIRWPPAFSAGGIAYKLIREILFESSRPQSPASELATPQEIPSFTFSAKPSSPVTPFSENANPPNSPGPYSEVLKNLGRPNFRLNETHVVPDFTFSSLRVVGEVGAAWIVCEAESGLILIDQHAAHERVQFEKILSRPDSLVRSKPLMVPLIIELPLGLKDQAAAVLLHFQKFGFEGELSSKPGSIDFNALPDADRSLNWENQIKEILEFLLEESCENLDSSQGLKNKLQNKLAASLACHGSVRRGQRLTNEQISALLRDLDSVEWGGFCPHGRPVWFELRHSQIENFFHR